MAAERTRAGLLLRRLAWAGIADMLLVSAFDIHRWRKDNWQAFDERFAQAAGDVFGQASSPIWLYAVAFPFVAVNFGCHVQVLRGRRDGIFWPLVLSALGIAAMPLIGGQGLVYRMIWPDILSFAGFAIGGAMAAMLYLELDKPNAPAMRAATGKD